MTSFFLHRIVLCPMDPSDNLTFISVGQSQAGRMQTSPIELNLACDDVIFSLSDNFLSNGKHACPMDPSDNLTFRGRLYKTLNHFFNHCFVVK